MKLLPKSLLGLTGLLGLAGLVGLASCSENLTPSPERAGYDAGPLAPLSCLPNLDGKIDAKELLPAFDVPARYLTSPPGRDRDINTAGTVDKDGKRVFDQGTDLADDVIATITAKKVKGTWYESSFPTGTFAAPFDLSGRIDAIYNNDDKALRILGLASTSESPAEGKTLVVYESPVDLYRFPLAVGVSYTSEGVAKSSVIRGQPYAGKDSYEVKVDGAGQLLLPDLTFTNVLRIRTKVTVTPAAGAITSRRQTSFLAECYGEVMRATSKDNEPNEEFTVASEVRRLGLAP
jgi:hypothetical protein